MSQFILLVLNINLNFIFFNLITTIHTSTKKLYDDERGERENKIFLKKYKNVYDS